MSTINSNNGYLRTGGGTGAIVCWAQLDYTQSANTATAVSYTLAVYIYCYQYGYTTSGVLSSQLSSSGQTTRSTSGGSCDLSANERLKLSGNWVYTFPKRKAAYTQRIYFQVTSTGNTVRGTSSGYLDVTIPALASYEISYNANGGTGTIESQTKYYGTNLTLSNGRGFTRTNHTLTRWNTATDGSGTSYALSATYTANSPLELYAQWHVDYIKPRITNATAYRVADASSSEAADNGNYIYISFSYIGGKLPTDESYTAPSYNITIDGVSPSDASASGTFQESSGSWPTEVIAYGPYSNNESHSIEIELSNTTPTGETVRTTETLTVGLPVFPIDLQIDNNNQTCMGIMTVARNGKALSLPFFNINGSDMIDFVVEEGQEEVTSSNNSPSNGFGTGYWRWREWYSGKVEIWYNGTVTLNTNPANAGGVYRYLRRITFPNDYALYKCICIVNGTVGGGWLNCGGLFDSSQVHAEPYTMAEVMAYQINALPSQTQTNTNIYICGEKTA